MTLSRAENLVIGSTSQLANYFPEDFIRVSSRDLNSDSIIRSEWNDVHIVFAEQRTYLAASTDKSIADLFKTVNYDMTKSLVNTIMPLSRRVFYYSTAELWNRKSGPIDARTPYDYYPNHYTESKRMISDELSNKKKYPNVVVVYPFNFNSILRRGEYLFGKVFRSIMNREPIKIGDTDYYREMLHPSMVVEAVTSQHDVAKDVVVGSGRLIHVGDFIRKLYESFGMDMDTMVESIVTTPSIYRQSLFYSSQKDDRFSETRLLNLLVSEINTHMKGSLS